MHIAVHVVIVVSCTLHIAVCILVWQNKCDVQNVQWQCFVHGAHSGSAQWTLALPSVRGRGTWRGGIGGTATIRQHKYCQDSDFDTNIATILIQILPLLDSRNIAKIQILIETKMMSTTIFWYI